MPSKVLSEWNGPKTLARDFLPRSLDYHPGEQVVASIKSDETLRSIAVARAVSVSVRQVFNEAQDREVFLGCLVATASELALILGINLSRDNFRILDVLVQCGLRLLAAQADRLRIFKVSSKIKTV